MCGVMLRETPARCTRCLIRNHKVTDANGVPRLVKNTFAGELRRNELGPPGRKVTVHRFHGFSAHRHYAFLVALADDVDESGVEMKLLQPQIFQLGQPQTGGVGQFQNRLVA